MGLTVKHPHMLEILQGQDRLAAESQQEGSHNLRHLKQLPAGHKKFQRPRTTAHCHWRIHNPVPSRQVERAPLVGDQQLQAKQ